MGLGLELVAAGPALEVCAVSIECALDATVVSLDPVVVDDGASVSDAIGVVVADAALVSDTAATVDVVVGAALTADVVTVDPELRDTARTRATEPMDAGASAVVAWM